MPFSNMTRPKSKNSSSPFCCFYNAHFNDLLKNIKIRCLELEYVLEGEYSINDVLEINVFFRKRKKEMHFFTVVYMDEYDEKYMDYMNELFAKIWKTYIENNEIIVKNIMLLCIDKYNDELGDCYWKNMAVDYKTGRYRLPVFWVNGERPFLTVVGNYNERKGKREYYSMRKEVLSILELSERWNNENFGSR